MNIIDAASEKIDHLIQMLKEKQKFSFTFLKNVIFQRWAIAIFLCIGLTLILSPNIYVSKPEYQHGMIASENIKADRDFDVEDANSTRQKRNDAAENTLNVYDYDAEMAITLITLLKNSFTLTTDGNDIRQQKNLLEKSWGVSLTDDEVSFIRANNRSTDLLNKLSRVLSSFYENTLITS